MKLISEISWSSHVQIRLAHDRRRAVVVMVDYVYLFSYTDSSIIKLTSIQFPLDVEEIHIATNQDYFLTCCDLGSFTVYRLESGEAVETFKLPIDKDEDFIEEPYTVPAVQTVMMNDHCILIELSDSIGCDLVHFW